MVNICYNGYGKGRKGQLEYMKKVVACLILILTLVCVACSVQSLASPDGLSLDYNVLSWNKVENADGYIVCVNGEEYIAQANYLELALPNGKYEIKVKAISNGKYDDSQYSEAMIYDSTANKDIAKLSTPAILGIDGRGQITWSMVGNSVGYRIFSNNSLLYTIEGKNTTSYTLDITEPGTYSIQIQAIGDNVNYSDSVRSNSYKFVIDPDGTPSVPLLATPVITYDPTSECICWTKIRSAIGYLVYLNDNVVERIDGNEIFSYKVDPKLTENIYTVKALGDEEVYATSYKSNAITFPLEPSEPPTGLSVRVIDGEAVVFWDKVDYSVGYRVEIGNKVEIVLSNTIKLNGYEDGEYNIRVSALGDGLLYSTTAYSSQISVKVNDGAIALPTLLTTDHVVYIDSVLYWNAVKNAESYTITVETPYDESIDTLTFTTDKLSLEIDKVFIDTVLIFYVKANAVGFNSSLNSYGVGYVPSASKTYVDDKGFIVTEEGDQYYFTAVPTEIGYDGESITWRAVEDSFAYSVIIDGTEYIVSDNRLEYDIAESITITISALTEKEFYYNSPRTAETVIMYPDRLATPTPQLEKYTLRWDAVDSADEYLIFLNGKPLTVHSTVMDLKSIVTVDGLYTLSVQAVAYDGSGYKSSLLSKELYYTVDYGEYGTEAKPYTISTYDDFLQMKEHPNAYYKIVVDSIDFKNAILEPLFIDSSFMGYLDGNGAVIKNFKISTKNGVGGFFGLLAECEIVNLIFSDVVAIDNSPILSSYATDTVIDGIDIKGIVLLNSNATLSGGVFATFSGTARNITSSIQIAEQDGSTVDGATIGGFSGIASGSIDNIKISGKITVRSAKNCTIGAFVGDNRANVQGLIVESAIVDCGSGNIGLISGVSSGTLTDAVASGSVSGTAGNIGGFGEFSGSFSGSINVSLTVNGDKTAYVGGFAAYLGDASVEGTVVSTIEVTASIVYVGGFVGYSYGDIGIISLTPMTVDINVTALKGYVGGMIGYYSGSIEGEISGNITVVATDIDKSDIRIGYIGSDNDLFIDYSEITFSGNMVE